MKTLQEMKELNESNSKNFKKSFVSFVEDFTDVPEIDYPNYQYDCKIVHGYADDQILSLGDYIWVYRNDILTKYIDIFMDKELYKIHPSSPLYEEKGEK